MHLILEWHPDKLTNCPVEEIDGTASCGLSWHEVPAAQQVAVELLHVRNLSINSLFLILELHLDSLLSRGYFIRRNYKIHLIKDR